MSRTLEITERCLGATPKIHDAPDWINQADNPYLHGIYAPTLNTNTHTEALEVIGELPTDLYGAYLRNGPNPVFKPKHHYHPFDGDGMIHGVFFNEDIGRRNVGLGLIVVVIADEIFDRIFGE